MTANKTEFFSHEKRSVSKIIVAEKCKLCKIYRRMCNFYGEACTSKMNYKWMCHYDFGSKMETH